MHAAEANFGQDLSQVANALCERAALWQPPSDRLADEPMSIFRKAAETRVGANFPTYRDLHAWSVRDREDFWNLLWDWSGVLGDKGSGPWTVGDAMLETRFFPAARLNYAENLLWKSGETDAVVFRCEGRPARRLSWDELRELVTRLQRVLSEEEIEIGDRVAAMMPNMPETVAAMLATASIGAVWTSCSPDFGEGAIVDRFGQTAPQFLIVPDGYWYNGKPIDLSTKIQAIVERLPSIRKVLVVDILGKAPDLAKSLPNAEVFADAIGQVTTDDLKFVRLPFDHPLSIHYSSGTTGAPKCIVHRSGGVLLQHIKEQRLHSSLKENDRLFYYSTCGWMMWNWLVTGLATGATLLLYDGSPFCPDGNVLFDYASEERCTHFGVSPKFIDSIRKAGLIPSESHDLRHLRTVLSTGSPLSAEGFDFVYRAIKSDVHLASIAGGTDILGCFALGVPTEPVFAGELQGPGLGMAVEVFDQDGRSLDIGQGELVCTTAFPSMPLGFWNDPDGQRYRAAYFERFHGVWHHGDFVEKTERGGLVFHGRSDATLNPGGVRIGTAEIYSQLDGLTEIAESACIGQDWENDVRVVLFVRLADGARLTDELIARMRQRIRAGASPRHVPAIFASVPDIPRTKSGKISELAIRNTVHGREASNLDALANPDALKYFRDHPALRV